MYVFFGTCSMAMGFRVFFHFWFSLWIKWNRWQKMYNKISTFRGVFYSVRHSFLSIRNLFTFSRFYWINRKYFLFHILDDWSDEVIFFYLPAAIILTVNVVLFVLILKRMRHVQQEASRLEEGTLKETNSKLQHILDKKKRKWVTHKHSIQLIDRKFDRPFVAFFRYSLYLRLFILTGISWLMEILWLVEPGSQIFIYTDIFNSLQGVYIFVLFVLNRRVLRLTKERFAFEH